MSALTACNSESGPEVDQSGPSTIPLYLINGVATIWDAQTAATLHCVHAVSGLRVGTLPGVAQQNGFLGLPVTLMREETAYLVQQGIAHLVPLDTSPTLPSSDDIEQHTRNRINRYRQLEQMTREAEAKRVAGAKAAFEKGGEKAKAKREARARAKAEIKAKAKEKAEAAGQDGDLFGADNDGHAEVDAAPLATPSPPQAEMQKSGQSTSSSTSTANASTQTEKGEPSHLTSSSTTVHQTANTTTTSSPSPGYFHSVPSHPPFPPLSAPTHITSLPHSLFPFPTTARDCALVQVYTTLQKRGYRMGLGPRFGGEYLIYPGDYLRYHAHFTSQVIVDDQPIRPAEIVAWGRLGTGTKKAGLLCCYDQSKSAKKSSSVMGTGQEGEQNDDGGVEFYSLEWANFG